VPQRDFSRCEGKNKWGDAVETGADIGLDQEYRREIGFLNLTSFNKHEALSPSL
jgi:hypothetical protein